MKRILVLAGRYYPKPSPNSICIKNILDELPKDEYDVEIVSYDDGLVTDSEYKITKFSRGFIQNVIYKLEDNNDCISQILRKLFLFVRKIKMLPFLWIWPWVDPIVTLKEFMISNKIYKDNPYDIIISVYMPLSSIIVGHLIKKTKPNVRFFAYFLDSLSGGYVPNFMKQEVYNRKSIWWEKILLRNADKIIFMQSSKKFHKKIYKYYANRNAIEYLDLPVLKIQDVNCFNNDKVNFVYVGSIASSIRSPEYILKLFHNIPFENWSFIFVGESNCDILNEYAKKDNRIKVIGRCSHELALEYERKATVLVNLGNKNANLTPSKVFEYIGFRKKILSTYWFDEDTSIQYLNKYPKSLFIFEKSNDLENDKKKIIDFVNSCNTPISDHQIYSAFWNNTPDAFIELLKG